MRRIPPPPPAPLAPVVLLAVLAGLAGARPAAAQTVMGTVIDHDRETPVAAADVQLLDADDEVVATTRSDDRGRFRISAPGPGTWRVTAGRIGFSTARSDTLQLERDQVVTLEIRLSEEAVPIDEPIVVVGEVSHRNPDIEAFHERRRRADRSGLGHFIYGDELERAGSRPTDLLRTVPGIALSRGGAGPGQLIRMRGGCIPAVFIDGQQINSVSRGESLDNYVHVGSIEGIEVYRGGHQPAAPYFDRNGCGVVLVWTKRGGPGEGEPFTWARLALMGRLAALVLVIQALF